MGMCRGFLTQEQRWCQPVPDPQNDGSGRVNLWVTQVDPFFKCIFFPCVFFFFLLSKSILLC